MTTTANTDSLSPSASVDALTASLVARQSRTDDGSMSVGDQVAAMRDYCERNNLVIGNVYEEPDVSGRRPLEKRHGLKRAVLDVEADRSQVILTAYFDRFVRSVATRAEVVQRVEKAGGRVVTLDVGETSDKTAASWLSGTMLAAISEFYARQVGEKLVASKQRNIDRGVPPFPRITPAYRRRDDGRLERHPTNAPLIAEACRMRVEGASYVKIHRFLVENDVRGEDGNLIGLSAVETTLASKLLIGEIHFGDFRPNLNALPEGVEPIIDRATFRKIQAQRSTRGRNAKSERLLARLGILVCETCGSRMTVHSSRAGRGGRSYPYYRCGQRHVCPAPASIAADAVDDLIRDEAIERSKDAVGRATLNVELEALRVEATAANDALANAIRSLAGLGGEAATKEVLDELQADRDAKVEKHARLARLVTPDETVTTLADWKRLSLDGKRGVVRSTIQVARVAPGRGGVERVSVTGYTLGEQAASLTV